MESFAFDHTCGIPDAYRSARTPMPSEELVSPLHLSVEEIRRLAAEANAWLSATR